MPTPSESLYSVSEKICSRKDCHLAGIPQPISQFRSVKARKGRLGSWCKSCSSANTTKWWKANKERHRKAAKRWYEANYGSISAYFFKDRMNRYGASEEWYQQKFNEQGGRCAICGEPQKTMRLAVDHDHDCCPSKKACDKCRRDLLCTKCNNRLGILEQKEWMEKAHAYLAKWDSRTP